MKIDQKEEAIQAYISAGRDRCLDIEAELETHTQRLQQLRQAKKEDILLNKEAYETDEVFELVDIVILTTENDLHKNALEELKTYDPDTIKYALERAKEHYTTAGDAYKDLIILDLENTAAKQLEVLEQVAMIEGYTLEEVEEFSEEIKNNMIFVMPIVMASAARIGIDNIDSLCMEMYMIFDDEDFLSIPNADNSWNEMLGIVDEKEKQLDIIRTTDDIGLLLDDPFECESMKERLVIISDAMGSGDLPQDETTLRHAYELMVSLYTHTSLDNSDHDGILVHLKDAGSSNDKPLVKSVINKQQIEAFNKKIALKESMPISPCIDDFFDTGREIVKLELVLVHFEQLRNELAQTTNDGDFYVLHQLEFKQ